jgi:hypothetical protein
VAHIKHFLRKPAHAHHEPVLMIKELGLAMIDPRRAGTDRCALDRLERHGITVRDEATLSRARVELGNGEAPTTRLDWLFEREQTWALNALGVTARDSEGERIKVGVIDSGIGRHVDVDGQVVERISMVPGKTGTDELGHGTHTAGLVAGRRAPAAGPRYGVAPAAQLVGVRVFGDDEQLAPEGMIRTAIFIAIQRGCRVLSLAAGRLAPTYTKEDEYLGRFLVSAGCILMAAAGNDSDRTGGLAQPTRAPANAPFVPAIGAMTATQQVWNNSNGVGDDPATRVDALAPGTNITSAWVDGGTMAVSGTSAATAIAAGVAAAVWSRDPTLPAAEIVRMLSRRARRIPDAPPGAAGDGYLQIT